MAKVVLGLFDDMDKAQQAMRALEADGFERSSMDLRSGAQLVSSGAEPATEGGEGIWTSIKQFFSGESSGEGAAGERIQGVRESDVLLTVHAEDTRAERAAQIIDQHGAEDIDERMGTTRGGAPGVAAGAGAGAAGAGAARATAGEVSREAGGGERRIPVAEEELRVGKREVETGGVRVRSRIIERPVERDVTLREEDVEVERRPVDRPAASAGEGAFKEESFEVHATSEEPVVEKRTRVKEEVSVRKEARSHEEKIRDKVRETEVDIEKLSPDEEREFASHASEFQNDWQAKYARTSGLKYEDVEPGYQYGYRLGRSGRYGTAEWSAVEPEVKNDWNQRGFGPWEQYRDAVRSGWERARRH